ncbi:MAG TPA: serine/threonine-protein kinase [Terracidiphilus sp.]|nr:serine/threonine-protein kinase [Terracidiphilus sp.]
MTRATDRGACPNPRCHWSEAASPESPQHLPRHYTLQNRYYIGRVLGQGGFGVTYIGRDLRLDRTVAIKEFLPTDQCSRSSDRVTVRTHSGDLAGQFRYGLEGFLHEAQNLARLGGHPNIVLITDHIEANGTAYAVMEFVPGVTLKQHLAEHGGRIAPETAKNIMLHVMAGLRKSHEVGLLHRDISPDNIMLSEQGPVKLIDFGAARYHSREASQSLSIILKNGYAPEEQYRARGNQGPWTDVYATAATLYRCITGEVPPSALDRLSGDAELRRPSSYCPQLPAAFESALMTALAVKAENRFQTIGDFQRALMAPTPVAPPPQSRPVPPSPSAPRVVHQVQTPAPQNLMPTQMVPPSLHWFAVLVLSMLTMGLFPLVWVLVQSSWIRKIDSRSSARAFFTVYVTLCILAFGIVLIGCVAALSEYGATDAALNAIIGVSAISSLMSLLGVVFFYIGAFAMRRSLLTYYNSVEPINLRLGGAMTFFFNILYIQYHLTRIANYKRTGVLVA